MIGNYIKTALRILENNLLFSSLAIGGITTGLSSLYIMGLEAPFKGIQTVNIINLSYSLIIFFAVGFIVHAYHEKTGNKATFIRKTLGASHLDIFLQFLTFSCVYLIIATVLGIILTDVLIRDNQFLLQRSSTKKPFSTVSITFFTSANFVAGIIITMVPYILVHKKSISQR